MFSRWRERLRHTLGFRLALWYAIVFVASSVAIVGLTYVLLAQSLRQYDREIIQTTIVQFASAYARGGVDALAREIRTVAARPTRDRCSCERSDPSVMSCSSACRTTGGSSISRSSGRRS